MIYHALIIELLTRTGGVVGDVAKVQAENGAAAVDRIVSHFSVAPTQVYLISQEEADVWAGLGISIKEIV